MPNYIGPFGPESIEAAVEAMRGSAMGEDWSPHNAARAGLSAAVGALDRGALVETLTQTLRGAGFFGERKQARIVIEALFPTPVVGTDDAATESGVRLEAEGGPNGE